MKKHNFLEVVDESDHTHFINVSHIAVIKDIGDGISCIKLTTDEIINVKESPDRLIDLI